MDLGDYREGFERDFDALDERYLIDRAEHEAHADGNEEEPDDPGEVEAPGNLTPAERLGWRIGWERGFLAGRAAAKTPDPDPAPPTLTELIDHFANMIYLWGSIAAMHGDDDPTARSYKTTSEEIRAEIQRRLDLVAERTGDDDGTTARIVEILNGRP